MRLDQENTLATELFTLRCRRRPPVSRARIYTLPQEQTTPSTRGFASTSGDCRRELGTDDDSSATHPTTDLVLLASLSFGTPFSLHADGKQVYTTPSGKLVCPHGELSSTICFWLAAEKKARLEGLPLPPRGGSRGRSFCDC